MNSRPWFVIDPPEGKVPAYAPTACRTPPLGPNGGERNTYMDRDLGDRCISFAFRMPAICGNSYQIVQTPGYVVLRREQVHDARVIPLDGRPLSNVRSYEGQSRGHWEGNTLVVETTNFDERVDYRGYTTRNLRVIERFTRIAPNKVEWSMTDRRSVGLRAAVDVLVPVDRGQLAADSRVRVSRGQFRHSEHSFRRAG
jgi:hypothetical protein